MYLRLSSGSRHFTSLYTTVHMYTVQYSTAGGNKRNPGLCRGRAVPGCEWRRAGGGAGRGPQSAVTTDMEINPGRIGMEGRVARRHCGHAGPSREPRKETENRERERDVTAV